MNIAKIDQILTNINLLSKEESEFLLYKLNTKTKEIIQKYITRLEINFCIYCGSIKYHKHDIRGNKQRYKCYDCKKTFTSTSNTIFHGFHKTHLLKFKKFLECFINNLSLPRTSEICRISLSCAFNWRHKVLSSIFNRMNKTKISGLIEIDEIYFRKSNKGNFKGGIGRKPRKHGYCPGLEDSAGLSKSKICISTAIDRSKAISINFVGFGKPNAQSLFNSYKGKIINPTNSKLITDGDRAYISFSKQIGCFYKRLLKKKSNNVRKLPVIQNHENIKYHIQNVNNFHSQIKDIINNKFKGVASKYLLKYINWIKWLRMNKENFYLMVKTLFKELSFNKLRLKNKEIKIKETLSI